MTKNKLSFRSIKETDLAYIINTWMHSARYQNRHQSMTNEDYSNDFKHVFLIPLLAKGTTFVRIACIDTEEDDIVGFLVYSFSITDELVIHQIYVTKTCRNLGIARKMIADVYPDLKKPIVASQFFKLLPHLIEKHANLYYNPYVVLKEKA